MKTAFTAISLLLFAEVSGSVTPTAQETPFGDGVVKTVQRAGKDNLTPEKKAELKRLLEIRRGGSKIARPGSMKGIIAIVNAQSSADRAWLEGSVEYLRKETNFSIEFLDGDFSFPKPEVVGGSTLYVIDNPSMPRVLVAPEDRWAMMNIAPLKSSKMAFFQARVTKEISRAFAMLCGGMTSNYGISLLGAVTKTDDLDIFPNGKLPVDVVMRMEPYMANLGVTPARLVPYRIACQEGWAPAPTNDVQRAIWNQIHAIPDKPLTIEFDPKKGR